MASTGQRIGGQLTFSINGSQYPARGNFEIIKSMFKREPVAGQDGPQGFTLTPQCPGIRGDLTTFGTLSLDDLEAIEGATIQVSLLNGKTYTLMNAWTNAAFTINTAEGKFAAEFFGTDITES